MGPPIIEPDPRQPAGPLGKLLGSLANVLASFIEIGRTRLELLTTELQEEVRRTAGLLALAFVALFAAGMGFLLAGLSLIFAYWDTHRVLVSVLVTAVFFLVAAGAGLVFSTRLRGKPRLLADTLAELGNDGDELRRRS